MKGGFFIFLVVILAFETFAQVEKPVLDTSTFLKWPSVRTPAVSSNGKYILYTVNNIPANGHTLIVQSTADKRERKYIGASNEMFSNDSRMVIFKTTGDSLGMLMLETGQITYIPDVKEFKLPIGDKGNWLAYRVKSLGREVVLFNLFTNKQQHFSEVSNYLFNRQGTVLVIETELTKISHSLQWVSLLDGKIEQIWAGAIANFFDFDVSGKQLIFVENRRKDSVSDNELWYYREGLETAAIRVDNHTPGIDSGLVVAYSQPQFNKGGNQVFFKLRPIEIFENKHEYDVSVDVWSYMDTKVQPLQLVELKRPLLYSAVINERENRVIRLEHEDEKILSFNPNNDSHFVIVSHSSGEYTEFHWNKATQPSIYLVSTKNGARKILKSHLTTDAEYFTLSPFGKWAIYYNSAQRNYFSYETATGIMRNITKNIGAFWINEESNDKPGLNSSSLTWWPAERTWMARDSLLLIYDNFDIWQIDPTCVHSPINITNGYGRSHNIQFKLLFDGNELDDAAIEKDSILVLRAFNNKTKENGFYNIRFGMKRDPKLLTMGPYIYYWPDIAFDNFKPQKASNAEMYLVRRMSATEFPNYFRSSDFTKFYSLTNLQPQKAYNWLTDQLIHWKTFDGSYSTGVLYKPEDFDPRRKYPIIFDYYERRSNELNVFKMPTASDSRINIPWFVSHGYLVFTPDIHYKIGSAGRSAYNSVASAAHLLSGMSWVDKTKMGLQGHSFGGFETNYIITQTSVFAAACSASGFSDLISLYGASVEALGRTDFFMLWTELGQGRMNCTIWQRPDLYIKNSPIIMADRITTPLLIMSNKNDKNVPFTQGVELFMALRRMGKKVWMLQYDRGDHSVNGKDAMDFTIRMTQFFDHYLKGTAAPRWMTSGIPAKLKGIDLGYELDNTNSFFK